MILATAILGAVLVRIEGLSTLSRIKTSVQRGELPTIELISGGILIISAVVLLTPGFITDVLGLGKLPINYERPSLKTGVRC